MTERFTLHVIHTTHTDIGYTDTQEKMKAHHIAFIREALELSRANPGFVWTCESYWAVHEFLKTAPPQEIAELVDAVNRGAFGLSASYFNLTDLVPEFVHHEVMDRTRRERERFGLTARSALTADVNGYSWGYADILARQGVENLMSSIHTHHGYHPLFGKQVPFWWESPQGERILSWVGEHYNFGNELGIAQTPWFEYTLQDGMSADKADPYDIAVRRIHAYRDSLLADGYELPFAPVSVCSYMTDNAPPSLRIMEFCERFNAEGHRIRLEPCTVDGFFDALRAHTLDFPTYRGDWTDWWADGIGSTPAEVIQYRAAANSLHIATKLDPRREIGSPTHYASAFDDLMFYGEHTWGYSSSITEPYHPQVNNLDQWKRLYALKATESATFVREQLQRSLGETAISAHRELKLRTVNPHAVAVEDMLVIDLEHFYGHEHFVVVDDTTGERVPYQLSRYSRGPELCIWASLGAGETRTYRLQETGRPALSSAGTRARTGIEGVDDLAWRYADAVAGGGAASPRGIDNDHFSLVFTPGSGITSIYDKARARELIDSARPYAAFTPIHEVTPRRSGEDYLWVRRNLGRNRKAFRTQRSAGRLRDVEVLEDGPLFSRVSLAYDIAGTEECAVVVTAYKRVPKLDIDLRVHKRSVWEPENLYLSLPFAATEFLIEKTGAVMRPRIDQLPGTCVDFYAVQSGMVFASAAPVVLATPDVPLVAMGPLEAHPIHLMGEGAPNVDEVYSWVMNNFWETNFKASLGGFHQFHYELSVVEDGDIGKAFATAEAMAEGIVGFYLFEGPRADSLGADRPDGSGARDGS